MAPPKLLKRPEPETRRRQTGAHPMAAPSLMRFLHRVKAGKPLNGRNLAFGRPQGGFNRLKLYGSVASSLAGEGRVPRLHPERFAAFDHQSKAVTAIPARLCWRGGEQFVAVAVGFDKPDRALG